MSVITIATTKGGAGKTTVAQMIIGAVHNLGYSVGVIDCDENQTLSSWLKASNNMAIETRAVLDETMVLEEVRKLQRKHDLVVIDTPGANTQSTVFAVGCANLVLIPLQLSHADVVEAEKTHRLVKSASEMTGSKINSRLIYTDYTPKTKIAKKVRKTVDALGLPTLKTRLHHLVAFKELTFSGKVPRKGTAGAQGQLLVQEVYELGYLPFMQEYRKAS
ncbi:MAG: AAA family ATPase [Pseudomonadales bacterium]